ncbi:MAG: ATP-binding protein [Deltaproteobacteria bacterium]|nr:ATP-binding protein [Deltaproteobacteria bacterium]
MNPKKPRYDESAIEEVLKHLLDRSGSLLDQLLLTGCYELFKKNRSLNLYLKLIEHVEKELLIQWKILKEESIENFIKRLRNWYNREIREQEGFFQLWNRFVFSFARVNAIIPGPVGQDSWRSFLIYTLSDSRFYYDNHLFLRDLDTEVYLSRVCALFEQMIEFSPENLCMGFLNLTEISLGKRPEILSMPKSKATSSEYNKIGLFQDYFSVELKGGGLDEMPKKLRLFWEANSGGDLSLFSVFRLKANKAGTIRLKPILLEKRIGFDQLIGIGHIKEKLLINTENFIRTGHAHHVLLWGARGTGKSSSVLALLKEFEDRGLKLIEVFQEELYLLPELFQEMAHLPEKFLILCDDIGFEVGIYSYNHIKTIIEGSVVKPAKNILLIATSNRKNLVYKGKLDPFNPEQKQLLDEKRALDDRFGLKLYFDSPIAKELLDILYHYADQTKLPYDPDELLETFRRFALLNNHDQPSGRTVKQFIMDWELNVSKKPDPAS